MKYPLLLLPLLAATALAAQPPSGGVDGLSQDDVAKAVSALKGSFVRPSALSDADLARDTLQGLLDRLSPEVALVSGSGDSMTAAPFYSEIYDETGYLRLGALTAENTGKASDVLKAWASRQIGAVVLDLRGTPASSDFTTAAAFEQMFCTKGTEMFRLDEGKTDPSAVKTFSTSVDPLFSGILVVLVDETTAEAPEAIAASLQESAKALIVGATTAGRALEYQDVPLNGAVLRMAVAEVLLPDGKKPGTGGLKPDISVAPSSASRAALVQSVSTHGIASVIQEHDRPHLNEAALVSGSNPEVDELEAEQSGAAPAPPLIDRQIEGALDLITSISIYKSKGAPVSHGGE
jgi:hypothetical protein